MYMTLKGGEGGSPSWSYMYIHVHCRKTLVHAMLSFSMHTNTHIHVHVHTTHTVFSAGTTAKVNNLGKIQQQVPILACIGELHMYMYMIVHS